MRRANHFGPWLLLLPALVAATPTPPVLPPSYLDHREEVIRQALPPDLVYPPRRMEDWRRLLDFLPLMQGPTLLNPRLLFSRSAHVYQYHGEAGNDCMFGWIYGYQNSFGLLICGRFFMEMARRQGVPTSVLEEPGIPERMRIWRIPRGGRVRVDLPFRFIPEAPRWQEVQMPDGPSFPWLNALPSRVEVSLLYLGTAEVRFPPPHELPGGPLNRFCPSPKGLVPVQRDVQQLMFAFNIPQADWERVKQAGWIRRLLEKGVIFSHSPSYPLPADWREGEEPWWVATEPAYRGCPYIELVAPPDEDGLVYALFLRVEPVFGAHVARRFDPRLEFTPMPTVAATVSPHEPLPEEKAGLGVKTPRPTPAPPAPRRVSVGGWLRALGTLFLAASVAGVVALILYIRHRGGAR